MPLSVPMLDLSRQYAAVGAEIESTIHDVVSAGRFVLGKEVAEFERDAAAFLDTAYAVGCASGTDALWLAMAACSVGERDTVITTPFSFFATASSILRCGARVLFADIDPQTFNLSPHAVQNVLQKHPETKAILPVHLYGQCADWDAFTDLKNRHDLYLVEDAAQAFGAEWRGTAAGSLGDAAAFSFYPTKNLSAWGDAGLVTCNDDSIGDRAQLLHIHGMRVRYHHESLGWNSRLDTVQAAVLGIKLKHIARWNQQRREIAARYQQMFTESGISLGKTLDNAQVSLPYSDPRGTHVWHQYVIRCDRRDALREHLTKHHIGSEIYYPIPLHQQEALSMLGYQSGDFPESERAAREVLALPIFPELRDDEIERVVNAVAEFYR